MTNPHVPAWEVHPGEPLSINGAMILTPSRAWCSGVDAANIQMRKVCRTAWSEEDASRAVRAQARLLRHLGPPWDRIAADMLGEETSS